MKQHNGFDEKNVEEKATSVTKMNAAKETKSLLPKKQVTKGKVKGVTI